MAFQIKIQSKTATTSIEPSECLTGAINEHFLHSSIEIMTVDLIWIDLDSVYDRNVDYNFKFSFKYSKQNQCW